MAAGEASRRSHVLGPVEGDDVTRKGTSVVLAGLTGLGESAGAVAVTEGVEEGEACARVVVAVEEDGVRVGKETLLDGDSTLS